MPDELADLDALRAAHVANVVADETAEGVPFTIEYGGEKPGPVAGTTQRAYHMHTPAGLMGVAIGGDPAGDAAAIRQSVADALREDIGPVLGPV